MREGGERRRRMAGCLRGTALAISLAGVCAVAGPGGGRGLGSVPEWLYPVTTAAPTAEPTPDDKVLVRLPGSQQSFTEAQLKNIFFAPDWHPEAHAAAPDIVTRGRAPDVYACGYCHLPDGQGRPENSSLAGLPAAYIMQQVADMKSGARHSAWHGGSYRPSELMQQVAANATPAEVSAAAEYFSAQVLRPRVAVLERRVIPRLVATAWIYARDPRGGTELLGDRVLEWAPDMKRHEERDDRLRYSAFVPPGSVARGRVIATQGILGVTPGCVSCHGEHLQGIGLVPALAGRSPTYLLRQLVAFQTGDRAGAAAAPMQPVVSKLTLTDMIAASAFAASRQPTLSAL